MRTRDVVAGVALMLAATAVGCSSGADARVAALEAKVAALDAKVAAQEKALAEREPSAPSGLPPVWLPGAWTPGAWTPGPTPVIATPYPRGWGAGPVEIPSPRITAPEPGLTREQFEELVKRVIEQTRREAEEREK
ncbi:MAG: hypothetical protein L0216_00055 [Planctomycetales bacterium]|nr:hypothetical protein [Planctomycetales bacterium]